MPHSLGLLDAHGLVIDGLAAWIAAEATDLRVTVCARSWSDLVEETAVWPEVLVMDPQPDDSVALEARIRICLTAGTVVVVTGDAEAPALERRVRAAGAAAYVSKTRPAAELVQAVRRSLARRTASAVAWDEPADRTPPRSGRTPESGPPTLPTAAIRFSEDEEETLRLYASGHSPVEVAMVLGTNIQAVKNALERVREQYRSEGRNADRKQDLMRRAAEDGYLA
ncbi:helix-turn-helix transcriptional regulator [Herbiconiux sp. YIM B11900]|uniref:helix-turn-helix transcriptional regulator n=1 Tax=Herbiconiux sp. YIM B11900 TaxID=3404131 RepID=UPI003F870870